MSEDIDVFVGTDDPYSDRGDPGAASKALKAHVMTEIVRVLRKRSLTTVQAAEIAGIGRSQISRIKNGRISRISLDCLVDVLDALTRERRVVLTIGYRAEKAAAG